LTSSFWIPARLTASSITTAPKRVAPILPNEPLKFPNGVLTAPTITASLMSISLLFFFHNLFQNLLKGDFGKILELSKSNSIKRFQLINKAFIR
jgi:hypothetical protein